MARLLVTGGAGYVGSHALRALVGAGHDAVVLDDLRAGTAEAAGSAPLVQGDAGDPAALARLFAERGPFEGVLHFAGSISVPESVDRPLLYYRNNTAASAALIEAALAHGVRAFVFSSTAAVYGSPARQPIGEDAPIQPESPYGASKAMVERMLADAGRAHGLGWLALRYFNASGADPGGGIGERHDPETHLIPLALEAAAGLRPALSLYGTDWPTPDGTCIRDYVHVTDLADAHRLGVEALLAGGASGCFNLGTGAGHSIRTVVAAVERVTGRRVPVEEAPRRPGDPPVLVADAAPFRSAFGWAPQRSDLDTIVRTAWEWLRSWRGL
ncbi:MAG TPA: UDP-glucose 4-epimerase GalE [Myxococcota bacterium]|nr:UDP-glucose 4-epimerase GalE [Myxococcota bacterium]